MAKNKKYAAVAASIVPRMFVALFVTLSCSTTSVQSRHQRGCGASVAVVRRSTRCSYFTRLELTHQRLPRDDFALTRLQPPLNALRRFLRDIVIKKNLDAQAYVTSGLPSIQSGSTFDWISLNIRSTRELYCVRLMWYKCMQWSYHASYKLPMYCVWSVFFSHRTSHLIDINVKNLSVC